MRRSVAILLLSFAGVPFGVQASTIYSVQSLLPLGSGAGIGSAINSSGATVGFVSNSQGYQVPMCFNCGATTLAGYAQPNGINDAGMVVGTSNASPSSVVEWSSGQLTNTGIAGYGASINNAGQIAGTYTTAGQSHAFLLTNGSLLDLGPLTGATSSSANAINSSGEVAGTFSNGGLFQAFLFNGTKVVNLGTPGVSSYGLAINDAGAVVGNEVVHGYFNAFEWTPGSGMQDLGTLGGTQSYAYGINDAGTVVGYYLTSNNASHGFIYLNGVMLDLNSFLPLGSGWTITAAYGINSAGDIVGTGTSNGQSYGIELTPSVSASLDPVAITPEPAAVLLAGLGLIVVGTLHRARRRS
jgi:probable HAF family extracellular repeat protein